MTAKQAYKAAVKHATVGDVLSCQRCGHNGTVFPLAIHHKVFRSHGGKTVPENLIVLCQRCHGSAHGLKIKRSLWTSS